MKVVWYNNKKSNRKAVDLENYGVTNNRLSFGRGAVIFFGKIYLQDISLVLSVQ